MSEIKLHIGCGKRHWSGWIHIDGADFAHIKSHDIFLLDEKFDNINVIYSSHLLEYFDREEGEYLLRQWYKKLNSGRGELRIAVPNMDAIANEYIRRNYELEQFLGLLYGKMQMNGQSIFHKTCYDYRSLNRVLARVGFINIRRVDTIVPMHEDDHSEARLPHRDNSGTLMSLNIICNKP